MGIDAAVTVEATVVDLLPNATVELKLENQERVLAHPAGAAQRNFMRLRPGDRVEVEISAYDRTRGRIVRLVRQREL